MRGSVLDVPAVEDRRVAGLNWIFSKLFPASLVELSGRKRNCCRHTGFEAWVMEANVELRKCHRGDRSPETQIFRLQQMQEMLISAHERAGFLSLQSSNGCRRVCAYNEDLLSTPEPRKGLRNPILLSRAMKHMHCFNVCSASRIPD